MESNNTKQSKYKESYSEQEVRDALKWVSGKCNQKEKERKNIDLYMDPWNARQEIDIELKAILEIKIGLEKYFKKLKYEENEIQNG